MNHMDSFLDACLTKLCQITIMINNDLLKACNEVCGYKKNRTCNVNTWWCTVGYMMRYKRSIKQITKSPREEIKNEYRRLKKAVARAMKMKKR